MAELFCDSDGEGKVRVAILDIGKYPGEYTKIVSGRLLHDGSRCDKCNRPLNKGEIAYYVAFLSESLRDPKGETLFFDMKEAKTARY